MSESNTITEQGYIWVFDYSSGDVFRIDCPPEWDAYNEWLPQDADDELITEKLPDDVRLKDCHWMHTHNPHHISILGK